MEARIIPKWIEHRIEPEERRRERRLASTERSFVGNCEQFLQSRDGLIGLSELRRHPGKYLDRSGPIKGVALDRHRGHRALREIQRRGFVPESHLG